MSNLIVRRAKEFRREHQLAENDPTGYVSNPINAFLLTKRLTSDWKSIEKIVTEDFASGKRRLCLKKTWKNVQ